MNKIGRMNRRIALYSLTETENATSGQIEITFNYERTVWAERNPNARRDITGQEKQTLRSIEEYEVAQYRIRKDSNINVTWIVLDDSVYYDIKYIDDNERNYMYLTCQKTNE